ncbi:hypothetical protein NDU88_006177 [Pleurodeles waltl]|uniref:Uncharacterized protein n=1 Tax=Pleurodeles waltl TaxID=8319 RepID=A0AAV7SNR7_PLEWA|nr:hypothetical protein NDU88_006177 [Pleurodeles waltl]
MIRDRQTASNEVGPAREGGGVESALDARASGEEECDEKTTNGFTFKATALRGIVMWSSALCTTGILHARVDARGASDGSWAAGGFWATQPTSPSPSQDRRDLESVRGEAPNPRDFLNPGKARLQVAGAGRARRPHPTSKISGGSPETSSQNTSQTPLGKSGPARTPAEAARTRVRLA